MTTLQTTLPAAPTAPSRRSLVRIYAAEARCELLKVMRTPAYAVPTLAFPAMFYLLFGVAFGKTAAGPVNLSTYLLATYGAFGVIGVALFGFGVGCAIERGQGWMLVKRASPMPIGAYFAGKVLMSLVFASLAVGLLYVLGLTLGEVPHDASLLGRLAGVLLLGVLPFCAMGLFIGFVAGPNSAPAIVNLIYLPMSFASGLWIPVQQLPGLMGDLAVYLPAYHYAQLALKVLGADQGRSTAVHLVYLSAFTGLCLAGAAWAYRRDEGKTYG